MNQLIISAILPYLQSHLSPPRFKHSKGTSQVAKTLALKHHVPVHKAIVAALLHDIGKGLTKQALVRYVHKHKVGIPNKKEVLRYNPWILHSFVSAHIAAKKFNITDPDMLQAIALHTLAGPRMSTLAKIIYLADITAPDRRHRSVAALRRLALRDLDAALRVAIAAKIIHVVSHKKWLHPHAVETWNRLITQ